MFHRSFFLSFVCLFASLVFLCFIKNRLLPSRFFFSLTLSLFILFFFIVWLFHGGSPTHNKKATSLLLCVLSRD